MKPKIFVLILNFNKFKDTESCIKSLQRSSLPGGTQILILDNSSRDASFKYLSKKFPETKILRNKKNLGFAAGNNVGIRYALKSGATHILIQNPDTLVSKNFLKSLLKSMENNKVDLIAPALEHYQNGKKFYGLEGSINWTCGFAKHKNVGGLKEKKVRPAEFVTFACVLIKSEVFKKAGLLNQKYFMYLEDVDYCLSAKKHGFKILLDPKVIVKHQTSSSFAKPTDKLLISFKSQFKFISSWIPFPNKLLAYLYALALYPYLYLLWTYHSIKRKA